MTRHQRNSTASSVYTYHERRKDAKASGYGSIVERLGKDAIKDFHCCSLTLQPCRDPVVTPEGFLFDKEALLEYILHQKREIARKLKEYEKQSRKDDDELNRLANAEQEAKAKKFVASELAPCQPSSTTSGSTSGISNMAGSKAKNVPSFWVPSVANATNVKETKLEKPDGKVYCPMSGKQLKLKDLIPVKFSIAPSDNGESSSLISKDRYKCAVSGDILTNSTPCAVLKTSGCVVTMDCVERIIRKDWVDPTCEAPLTESDIIQLQRGGTGFAAANGKLTAKLARPVMELQ